MTLIEIDGLPIKKGDFPWRTVSHNQRVNHIEIPENPSNSHENPEDFTIGDFRGLCLDKMRIAIEFPWDFWMIYGDLQLV